MPNPASIFVGVKFGNAIMAAVMRTMIQLANEENNVSKLIKLIRRWVLFKIRRIQSLLI
jgi:hypothetical protein